VLVAEDNAINQLVAARLLQSLGYVVDMVENGQQAVEAVRQGTYDLVLMDCHMPEMDGFELVAEIRRREHGSGAHLPIIAMTADAMKGDRERCLAAGMDDYLAKPVRAQTLLEVLERWRPRGDAPADQAAGRDQSRAAG